MAGIRVFAAGTSVALDTPYQAFGAGRQSTGLPGASAKEQGEGLHPVAKTSSRNPKRRSRSVLRDVLNSAAA